MRSQQYYCLVACNDVDRANLFKVRLNLNLSAEQLLQFMKDNHETIAMNTGSDKDYCPTEVVNIELHCFCMTPWIDGSTSAAIYGSKQKEFNMHNCCKCNKWYRKYCLRAHGITPPGRKTDYICPECEIPNTLSWHHDQFINTCTSDNFLTILLLYLRQHPQFLLSAFGCSEIENTLKGGLKLMLAGKIYEGKTLILNFVKSALNLNFIGKYDCHGGEHNKFLCLLTHISKVVISQKCTSKYCPSKNEEVTRYTSTFSFSNSSAIDEQLDFLFPNTGTMHGYCGANFHSDPPKNSPHALNDRLVLDGSGRETFYECRGIAEVSQASFSSSNPWVIPIDISAIAGNVAAQILPRAMVIYGIKYQLGGFSLHIPGHFTSIILWHGKEYFYDGLLTTKEQRFVPCKEEHLSGKMGSFAYYFIDILL